MSFLQDLSAKLGPLADKELAVLKALKASVEGGEPKDQVTSSTRPHEPGLVAWQLLWLLARSAVVCSQELRKSRKSAPAIRGSLGLKFVGLLCTCGTVSR